MKALSLMIFLVVVIFCGMGICQTVDSSVEAEEDRYPDSIETSQGSDGFSPDTDQATGENSEGLEDEESAEPTDSSAVRPVDSSLAVPPAADTGTLGQSDSALAAGKDSVATVAEKKVRPLWLYPGISLEQDTLARLMVRYFGMFDWTGADRVAKKMQRLEKRDHLPPLSYLLLVGMRAVRVQKGEYEDERGKKNLIRDAEKLARKGLELADSANNPDSLAVINKFIIGGIRGFSAVLEIESNPIKAAIDGFSAQKLLREVARQDTVIKDAYLGLGLFNCLLARAPFIVRGTLSMIGKEVSHEKGLLFLRSAALYGRYTADFSRILLVEFLSPFMDDETEEKRKHLRFLQKKYPENPWYVFLELDENICFHPQEVFAFSSTGRVKRQIARFKLPGYSARRYATLVKWQYLLTDPFPAAGLAPDTTINLRGFSYYPVFLRAIKEKYLYEKEPALSKRDRERRLRFIRDEGQRAARMIESSTDMPLGLKNFYLWHLRDGLRVRQEDKK